MNRGTTLIRNDNDSSRTATKTLIAYHLHRKLPRSNTCDSGVDNNKSNVDARSAGKNTVLSGLRQNYVSRGLRRERSSTPTMGRCCYSTNATSLASKSTDHQEESTIDDWNISDARRSVALLKFALPHEEEESETENDTDDDSDRSYVGSESTTTEDRRRYTIKFQCYVKVVEIPNRHGYTSQQQKRMWNDGKSIDDNAKRNRIEYEWERREWRNVPEEEDFCTLGNGNIVRPAYVP